MRLRFLAPLAILALGLGPALASAQTTKPTDDAPAEAADSPFPTPPDGWWEQVEAGWSATYEITQPQGTATQTLTVESIEGSVVTVTATIEAGGQTPPPQTQTIDFAEDSDATDPTKNLPAGAEPQEVGEETIEVAGEEYACTIIEMSLQGTTIKFWVSEDLPPLFNSGIVKMEQSMGEMSSTMRLVSYSGGRLE